MVSTEKTENEIDVISNEDSKSDVGWGWRHIQSFLMFMCITIAYSLRVNMSVAIVAMTDPTAPFDTYNWPKHTQDVILSSFFWGYVITQVPAAYIGKKYGTHIPLGIAMFLCSVATVATPWLAPYGWSAVVAGRVIQGLCQGFVFPSTHALLAVWIPSNERGRFVTFVYAGAQFGTILALPLSGFLSASPTLGWPTVFYSFGSLGITWSILWFIFGASSPQKQTRISQKERHFIESSFGDKVDNHENKVKTPWCAIMTSLPMWALIIVHSGQNWGFWTLLTEMPTYMKYILNYDLKANGLTSALPYLVMWLLSFVFSFLSDYSLNHKWLSLEVSRKLNNTIAHWLPALALIGLGYVQPDQRQLAVALLTIAVGLNSASYVGFQVNHIDLAPNHAGAMMGITNCAANIMSILAPLLVGAIVTDEQSVAQWRIVFFISAGFYFFGNLFFICFGSASVQKWNNIPEPDDDEANKESTKSKSRNSSEVVSKEKSEKENMNSV